MFYGIKICRFVYLDSGHGFRATHLGKYCENTCAGAHIYHAFMLQRKIQYKAHHLGGGVMMTRAERHLGIDHDIIFCLRHISMECGMNSHLIADNDRFEIIFLPLRIPILSLYKF